MPAYRRLSLLLLLALTACAAHRPHNPASTLPPAAVQSHSTLISYRTLRFEDFEARAFTGRKPAGVEGDVGAASAVLIDTTPHRIHALSRSNADSSYYEAVVDSFAYRARFDPANSWFNPVYREEAALLQHEQIHFAIAELACRAANAQLAEIRERMRSRARDSAAAERLAGQRFEDELARVRKEARVRQETFDRETENGTHIKERQRWARDIDGELKATSPRS